MIKCDPMVPPLTSVLHLNLGLTYSPISTPTFISSGYYLLDLNNKKYTSNSPYKTLYVIRVILTKRT